jgi:hypothetical protein
MRWSAWKPLVVVPLTALVVVAGTDLALQRIEPLPPVLPEVDDGIADLERMNPDLLILGSSHTRSFIPLAETLDKNGDHQTTLVAVEWGTFYSYNWVLQNRIRPLLDERDASGKYKRDRVRRAILVTTFYDLCAESELGSALNLPARAWAFRNFAADAWQNGLTDFNRNWLQTQFKRLFLRSVLMQSRGYDRLLEAIHRALRPPPPGWHERQRAQSIAWSTKHMEDQFAYCDDADEKRELRQMIEYLNGRGLEVTVVAFALMPAIVSERSKQTTVKRYADYVLELQKEVPFKFVDFTDSTPLGNDDFQDDLDHANLEGRKKFSSWALDHDLAYLKTPVQK